MNTLLISYDLRNQRNYQPVWDYLNRLGAKRILESLWLVRTAAGTGDVRDALMSIVDSDDGLVVIQLPVGAAWSVYNALTAGTTILQSAVRTY